MQLAGELPEFGNPLLAKEAEKKDKNVSIRCTLCDISSGVARGGRALAPPPHRTLQGCLSENRDGLVGNLDGQRSL